MTYHEIRAALTNMYEDTQGGSRTQRGYVGSHHGDFQESYQVDDDEDMYGKAYYQNYDGYPEEDWRAETWSDQHQPEEAWVSEWNGQDWPEDEPEAKVNVEELKALMQAQEEAEKQNRDLQMMMAENDRNLTEARKAVAAATKDRGWGAGPQQSKGRPGSMYQAKGKNKGKGKSYDALQSLQVKIEGIRLLWWEDFQGPKGSKGGKSGSQFVLNADYELMTLEGNDNDENVSPVQRALLRPGSQCFHMRPSLTLALQRQGEAMML